MHYRSDIQENQNVELLNLSTTEIFARPPFYKGELIYFDNHHLNEVGAKEYAKIASILFGK